MNILWNLSYCTYLPLVDIIPPVGSLHVEEQRGGACCSTGSPTWGEEEGHQHNPSHPRDSWYSLTKIPILPHRLNNTRQNQLFEPLCGLASICQRQLAVASARTICRIKLLLVLTFFGKMSPTIVLSISHTVQTKCCITKKQYLPTSIITKKCQEEFIRQVTMRGCWVPWHSGQMHRPSRRTVSNSRFSMPRRTSRCCFVGTPHLRLFMEVGSCRKNTPSLAKDHVQGNIHNCLTCGSCVEFVVRM